MTAEKTGAGGSAPAPVPAGDAPSDERAAFEAHIARDCGDLSKFGSGSNIHYRNSAVNNAWAGWKARAALSKQVPAGDAVALVDECKRLVVELYRDTQRLSGSQNAAESLLGCLARLAPLPEPVPWPTFDSASDDPLFHECRAIMGTADAGQDDALRRAINNFVARQSIRQINAVGQANSTGGTTT